ncbi:filamentous hemagglutinin family protein [Luteolibacter yonseiensis]|uniref:filamentous hemagglutinin family protein n=1 Tax=Luteolibacter yonseiensis TaxID=1144680 RepID=UPI0031E8E645
MTVQKGAKITTSVSADGNGGRIMIVGANVTNSGTLSSAAGQTILAAGLQVGVNAHDSKDPSLRGLDVYVGAVADTTSSLTPYAGTVINDGIIEIARGSTWLTGKNVNQLGVINSTTSVSLNGRIDLIASYDAVSNKGTASAAAIPFLYRSTGSVTLGEGSITQILPEYDSKATTVGTELALRSQINLRGRTIHLASGSTLLAPNAVVSLHAGNWVYAPSLFTSTFVSSGGQVYLDQDSVIDLAGTKNVSVSVTQNLLTLELRGSELAPAPLQRDGKLRGQTITVDIGERGNFEGRDWIGTPLADVSGYVGLVERTVGQLTTAGGTLDISAGGSVVVRENASIDVSGGWTNFEGGVVKTTQVVSGGRIVDIADARPDQPYQGIYDGTNTVTNAKWGVSKTFSHALAPSGAHYREGYTQGADAGKISISAPSMALDGKLTGKSYNGPTQSRDTPTSSSLPLSGSLTLNFRGQDPAHIGFPVNFPSPPKIVFGNPVDQAPAADFTVDANGNPLELEADRKENVHLSTGLTSVDGFGRLTIRNEGGSIIVPEKINLDAGTGGSVSFTAGNIEINGSVTAASGTLSFNALNLSPYDVALRLPDDPLPLPNPGRGIFTLGANARLSTAGLVTDDRFLKIGEALTPASPDGGKITISAFSADLNEGAVVDVSGGYAMTSSGSGRYGNGGSIAVKTGQDLTLPTVLGGNLKLGATLLGYSGAKAGALSLQAPQVQIGGTTTNPDTLLLDPEFFNQGGFGDFTLTGLGVQSDTSVPAVHVTEGTVIRPVAKSFQVNPTGGKLTLDVIQEVVGERPAVSVRLAAPGVSEGGGLLVRGSVLVDEGAVIDTDPGATISLTGNTVTVLGKLHTAGGNIVVGGGSNTANIFGDTTKARTTTYLGSKSVLSTAGTVVLTPDAYGRRTGKVLSGGNITLTGNIAAATGSVLDVSGASGKLDIPVASSAPGASAPVPTNSGLTLSPEILATVRTQVDSNGGNITLSGGQMLFSDATLLGNAGGKTALGGSLKVSSGRFYALGEVPLPTDASLVVSQTGLNIDPDLPDNSSAIGLTVSPGRLSRGYFSVDSFTNGGFDSLALDGVVEFKGKVDIAARGQISVANGGILYADSDVSLTASHVKLGRPMSVPVPVGTQLSPFQLNGLAYAVAPTFGTGKLSVKADVIDVGDLVLRGIGQAGLTAADGDIRGYGTFTIAGDLTLKAGQIHPVTASDFNIFAYDYQNGGLRRGSVTIQSSGTRNLPLSAGGNLRIMASEIVQGGVLRAPFGTITLGWDGTGTAPKDLLTGNALAVPVTKHLTLSSGSTTSVSAVDPATGKGIVIPYGINTDGNSWIDPRGVDITASGLPERNIVLAGEDVSTLTGSVIDVRGGGDLHAYRWVQGLGGPTDILASNTSFAIIPGYDSSVAPIADFNAAAGGGYANGTLKAGDRIYLNGSKSLPAGYYTLLPARYALLPGAVLVSPSTNNGAGSIEMPDKSSVVSGYRYNDLNSDREIPTLSTRFEVATSKVVRARAEYEDYLSNSFLVESAVKLNKDIPLLAKDSGSILFKSSGSMTLLGSVASASVTGGRGASVDISTARDIVISNGSVPAAAGVVALDANALNAFGAESLLIGGYRTKSASGTKVTSVTGNLVIDNKGTSLSANDVILVSNDDLTLKDGARVEASDVSRRAAVPLSITGNGTLLRVTSSDSASVSRTGSTSSAQPQLTLGENVSISGGSLILDSSAGMELSTTADLDAASYAVNSGRISLQLDGSGNLGGVDGLVLSGGTLADLQKGKSLSLLSYSSIDIYGTGRIGSEGLSQLTLSAGSVRGFNQNDGSVSFNAENILLNNSANSAASAASAPSGGTLEFNAATIRLGAGELAIRQYDEVVLDASRNVLGSGTGGLTVQKSLSIHTPLLAGLAGAKRTITAGGKIDLTSSGDATFTGDPGSSLSLKGSSINVDTAIFLPSGSLELLATSGDVTVSGHLDVSGVRQDFRDVSRYTNAGSIKLASETGDVVLTEGSTVNVAAHAGGGNAGILQISTPAGRFVSDGSLSGKGGKNGSNGVFELDVKNLASVSALSDSLTSASLTGSQRIRVRNGSVLIDGIVKALDFSLSADQGSITVTGTVDASGDTGGSVRLTANNDVILADGSTITVAGKDFSAAGKGGSVTLEAGSQRNGVAGAGSVDIRTGSVIDLSVASKVAGDAVTLGSSASEGKFSGKLHIRAPQISGNKDIAVGALNGTIIDASSILVEGYRIYDLTSGGGAITTAVRNGIHTDAQSFLGAAGTGNANYTAMTNRLLANNGGLGSVFVLAPGVEIINRTGDLTLGSSTTSVANDWDLATFRYGAKSAAGVLTLRAAGSLNFFSALSDGFTVSTTLPANNATRLWLARPTTQNALLPVNMQSWSYRLAAGADQTAADFSEVLGVNALGTNAGFLKLGNNRTNTATTSGTGATTSSAIANTATATSNGYQVIRTGSGDIEIHAGRSVQLLNQFATIYTAGTRVADPTLGGTFDLPSLSQNGIDSSLGAVQQSNPAAYTIAGGNVSIFAGQNIEHLTRNSANELVADSQLQLPNNWLYKRGYVDPLTGEFGTNRWGESASTTWWVDFTNFFQGVGALGGGDVTMVAGNNISNVDAVIPTNMRSTGFTDATRTHKTTPGNATYLETGGGNLTVRAANDIDAGVYYVERGHGELTAGGSIHTNATRSAVANGVTGNAYTQLPTTLFLGKGGFDVSASGDVLMGPVANPFLMPGGLNNSFWQKTYFSTYGEDSQVNISSLGGDVTLRLHTTIPGQTQGVADHFLQLWITNKQLLSTNSAANAKPWLRLSENQTSPFRTLVSLAPGTVRTTSFNGDVNLVGDLTLSPSSKGTVEMLASGSINALQPNGISTVKGVVSQIWGAATINLSDADPTSIPGYRSPFAYHVIAGDNPNAASVTSTESDFLGFIDDLFEESGGTNAVSETKQALHSPGLLHRDDTTPTRLYALGGDISGLTLFSPKAARVLAGQDIQDVSLYIQNLRSGDASIVSSGRNIILSNSNSPLRIAASSIGNATNFDSSPLAGDIQVSGPGTLQVLAGGNLDLGTVPGSSDGTGVGITSIGNARNPYLPFEGANLVVGAGMGEAGSLATGKLNFAEFIEKYVITEKGAKYLKQIAPGVDFQAQPEEEQARLALEVFYQILRDAGRDYAKTRNYKAAKLAIKVLFGDDSYAGEILSRGRDIRTASGGNIDIITPGGGVALAETAIGNPLSPPGIITASGGNISIFARNDISIGIGRIFTLRGGDEILWSSKGDIAAGSSSKTVKSAPPTRILIDPQSAAVQTDLAGLATGGGIGVLATVAGVKPGNVDLIAPEGTVDAGDAGIRVSGNLNIAANQVLNAGNISVSGNSAGAAAPAVSSPSISGLTAASNSTAATNATTTGTAANEARNQETTEVVETPSIISVEIIGYGSGSAGESDADKEDEEEKESGE